MKKKIGKTRSNSAFIESELMNDETYYGYLERFKRISMSIFEWINLPESMDSRYLERCLYYDGMASLLKDKDYGYINTRVAASGNVNIYGLPTTLNCYSYDYQKNKKLFTGLLPEMTEEQKEAYEDSKAVLVMNNWDGLPTEPQMAQFARRLTLAERSSDTNIEAMRTPVMVLVDENQRLMMENLYAQYSGNRPFIFGDKNQLSSDSIKAINTEAPIVFDKLQNYKKEIWNEALTFLGINNLMIEKSERLITDEASSNNELINLNLQSQLAPRQKAAEQFNELFGLKGTDKEIKVRVRSDLYNIIKNSESIVNDYKALEEDLEGGNE